MNNQELETFVKMKYQILGVNEAHSIDIMRQLYPPKVLAAVLHRFALSKITIINNIFEYRKLYNKLIIEELCKYESES